MFNRTGLWIDHAKAQIVENDNSTGLRVRTILSNVESKHKSTGLHCVPSFGHIGGNRESRYDHRREEELKAFYDRVIYAIENCDILLILGPGEAKCELHRRMLRNQNVAGKVVGVIATGKMTPAQIYRRVCGVPPCNKPTKHPIALVINETMPLRFDHET